MWGMHYNDWALALVENLGALHFQPVRCLIETQTLRFARQLP